MGGRFSEDYEDFDGRLCPIEVAKRLCGQECADALLRNFAGMRIYFPLRLTVGHSLIKALGEPAAHAICDEIGGVVCNIPLRQRRDAVIERLSLAGLSAGECAREAGVTERTVHRARRRLGIQGKRRRPSR